MKDRSARRGSVILVTLIFATAALLIILSQTRTLMQQYETTVDYGIGQSAFHLSESGLERAMHAITEGDMGSDGWNPQGTRSWSKSFSEKLYRSYEADTTVSVNLDTDQVYTITALTGVKVGGELVQSAVEIKVRASRTVAQEENSSGSGIFGYGMVAKDGLKLNHNNPGMRVASYNSDTDYGVPVFGQNTGYDIVVATPSKNGWAININNAYIHGAVRSGGGTIGYSNSHPHDPRQNATVIGPDSGMTYGVDPNRISTDFDAEIPSPDYPTTEGRAVSTMDQNDWQNKARISLGSWNQPTWVSTERINSNNGSQINIVGDVVIDAQRNLNLGADVNIAPGATLIIMAGENIHINAQQIDQQYPAQLQIIAKNNQDVVLNNFKVFTGVINAPNSNVRLAGVGGSPKSQFRGAIVARYIEVTNGAEFYYDTNLGGGGQSDSEDAGGSSGGIAELKLLSWREVSPASLQ
ncbi:hypothetical protein H5P28_01475 [Ruficoccus amylovorans]|uniref:DUF7305 domain-containing protein n=1 Tax=Ruficoccus amylovorans TaxID=1804625 RepID=A0A842H9C4_9BACT|nr:hypothetical protein [Ruficoccus amylovorans]MBC2592920.1 hypothetical protein [Ruficoccus amylovorans]